MPRNNAQQVRPDPACFLASAQPINVPSRYVFLLITHQAPHRQAPGGNRRLSGAKSGQLDLESRLGKVILDFAALEVRLGAREKQMLKGRAS